MTKDNTQTQEQDKDQKIQTDNTTPPSNETKQEEGKEKQPEPTPEEIEQNKKNFVSAMFGDAKLNAEEEKAAKEKEEADKAKEKEKAESKEKESKEPEEPKETKPKAKKSKEKEPKESKTAARKILDDDETRIETAAELAAQRVMDRVQPPAKPAEKQPENFEDTLPPEYRRDLEVLRRMEQDDPSTKGVSQQMMAFYKKEADYIAAWEKENPKQAFNADDTEHQEFYAQTPKFNPYAFDRAKEALIEERVMKKTEERQRQREETLKAEVALEKAQPELHAAAADAVLEMLKQTDPEAIKPLLVAGKDKDGNETTKLVVNKETIEKLAEEDEFIYGLVEENAEKLRVMVTELEKLSRFSSHYKENFNHAVRIESTNEKVFPHQFLHDYAVDMEQDLAKMSVEESQRGGKKFITQDGWRSRLDKIVNSGLTDNQKEAAYKDLQGRYWVLTSGDIKRALVADFADRVNSKAKKYIQALTKKAGNSTRSGSKENEDDASEKTAKPKPPSMSSDSDKLNTKKAPTSSNSLTADQVAKSMWG